MTLTGRLGFWMAVTTAALTVTALGLAVTTLPRSGPSCTYEVCLQYPYTDISEYFPRDYFWMVPATLLLFPFVALLTCVHSLADDTRKPFSATGLAFAAMSAAILITTYFIQLTVVPASIERGELDGLSLLSQYNPHGLFIAFESVGYSLMSVAFLAFAGVFRGSDGISRALRWLFVAAFLLTALSLVTLIAIYGNDLEYRFEIAVISINWIALAVGSVLLAFFFRPAKQSDRHEERR